MSEQTTQGPWTVEGDGDEVSIVNREHDGDDWDIATVHSTLANAHLIAAAPEMLKALKEYVAACSEQDIRLGPITGDAKAAIAKAEGRT